MAYSSQVHMSSHVTAKISLEINQELNADLDVKSRNACKLNERTPPKRGNAAKEDETKA